MSDADQLRQLAAAGMSDPDIAARLGVSPRTVLRRRHALGIGSEWAPPLPPHGTARRYGNPHKCRCRQCTDAATEEHRAWRAAQRRVTAPLAARSGRSWTPEEDALIRASDRTTAALARQLGRSYDATRKRRDRLRDQP